MPINKTNSVTKAREKRKYCLFGGLFLLALSAFAFLTNLPSVIGIVLMGGGICLKALFLILLFSAPDFKLNLEIYLILTGVGLILISLLFKNIYPVPLVRNTLFYIAIALKATGISLLFLHKKDKF